MEQNESKILKENSELKKENKELKLEIEILKKFIGGKSNERIKQ